MRPHTLASIAEECGVNKRAVQDWLKKARANKSMLTEDIGEIINGARHFNDAERDILLQYASTPRRKSEPAPTAKTEVLPNDYPDPFAGVAGSQSSAITKPGHFQATDRSGAIAHVEQRVQEICSTSALNQQQSIQEIIANGNQTGQALGAFLAQSIIQSAEEQKNALLAQYMQSQGVNVSPKQSEPQKEPVS